MAAGLGDVSGFDTHGGLTTAFSGLIGGDETAMFASVLSVWQAVSGFTSLGQVADGNVGFGAPNAAGGNLGDIRVGSIVFDGQFGVLAHAYQPGTQAIFGAGGSIAGDAHFDVGELWADDPTDTNADGDIDLYTVMLHELGHALGLDHSAVVGSVMEPFYGGARRTLTADDIAGIQAIYGPHQEQAVPEASTYAAGGAVALVLASVWRRQRRQQRLQG